jgi:hypothetical protein
MIRASVLPGYCLLILAASPSGASGDQHDPRTREFDGPEWIRLFDGKSFRGWRPVGAAQWRVQGGTIGTDGTKPGFLMSTGEYDSFDLHVEFRAPASTNSGVFLRSTLRPADPTKDCFELNIAPADNAFPTGSLVGRQVGKRPTEWLDDPDHWHSFDVLMMGDTVIIYLSGRGMMKAHSDSPLRGHIGLQSNQGPVEFRNIRIRKRPQ